MINRRAELVEELAKIRGITKTEATGMINDVASVTKQLLDNDGDLIKLAPLGTFKVVHKPSRKCRNPATGESMMTTPKNVVKFS